MEERITGLGSFSIDEVYEEITRYGDEPVNVRLERGFTTYEVKESPEEMYDTLEKLLCEEEGQLYYDVLITGDRENQLFEFRTEYGEVSMTRVVRKDG